MQSFHQFPEEALCGAGITMLLHQDIEDLTVLVHRPNRWLLWSAISHF
jgi:hypothetical protein